MATPITHILLALQVLPLLKDKNVKEFIVGTSFPDIRYLGVIEREKTHKKEVTWKDVKKENSSFKAGMLFHSLVDQLRVKFFKKHQIDKLVLNLPYIRSILKLFEDKLLYDKTDKWPEIAHYFDTILPEEKEFGIAQKDIKKWHTIIKWYIQKKPTESSLSLFFSGYLSLPESVQKNIMVLIRHIFEEFENNKIIKKIIFDFYDSFPELILKPLKKH